MNRPTRGELRTLQGLAREVHKRALLEKGKTKRQRLMRQYSALTITIEQFKGRLHV